MNRPHRNHILGRLAAPVLAALALAGGLAACAGAPDRPLDTVANFDIGRYLGTWHQVAATPAWFQDDCKADTTATYSEAENGLIKVVNACLDEDGDPIDAEARARFLEGPETAKLEVTFVRLFGNWFWGARGDYWVIGLDADYRWAVIGQPSRKYAWVLARTEELDAAALETVRGILTRAGYDPCALNLTTPTLSGPLCKAGG